MRRAAHEGFNVRASVAYQSIQEQQAVLLACDLLEDDNNWDEHIRRSVASTVLTVVYDWEPLRAGEDMGVVKRINDTMSRIVSAGTPGRYLVDIFPCLLRLPDWMAKWKRDGKEYFRKDTEMFERFMEDVDRKMVRS